MWHQVNENIKIVQGYGRVQTEMISNMKKCSMEESNMKKYNKKKWDMKRV